MRNKGFTLVELAVTLSIIVILMAVSVPIYRSNLINYKRAEGYALLAAIRSAQEKYYSEYGTFLTSNQGSGGTPGGNPNAEIVTSNEEVLGINARTNKFFRSFCIARDWPNSYCGYRFKAAVYGGTVGNLEMEYNVTSGVRIY
ncbi:MAG: prepilin-type N-terminal cleavage/methylation domain-containing protein [Elusimicrobia bacterium]|nr:prepilin-type N-terminal cleavage/methylation domain-containing protein [Elusimicrobiota bacterium]